MFLLFNQTSLPFVVYVYGIIDLMRIHAQAILQFYRIPSVCSNTKCQKCLQIFFLLTERVGLVLGCFFLDRFPYNLMNRCVFAVVVLLLVAHVLLLLLFLLLFTGNYENDDRCSAHRRRHTSSRVGSSLPCLPHPAKAQFQLFR